MASAANGTPVPTPQEVRDICAIADNVIRNLRITECYHRLSIAMSVRTGACSNWCTFATWASRQAGRTIRGEDLMQHLAARTLTGPWWLHPVQSIWRVLLRKGVFNPQTLLGRVVRAVHTPFDAFERASDAVARGNLKVFEEIAFEFARYLADCPPGEPIDSPSLQKFLAGLRPGDPPGGQDLLRAAFISYQQQSAVAAGAERAQLVHLANLWIGLHEQTRLQPEIQESLEVAPVTARDLGRRILRVLWPGFRLLDWLAAPLEFVARRYILFVRKLTREILTEWLMVLALPGGSIALSQHLARDFDASLKDINNPDLQTLWSKFEPNSPHCSHCGATDWADLKQRMHFILHLFRCYHSTPDLFEPPFSQEQVSLFVSGRVPQGRL